MFKLHCFNPTPFVFKAFQAVPASRHQRSPAFKAFKMVPKTAPPTEFPPPQEFTEFKQVNQQIKNLQPQLQESWSKKHTKEFIQEVKVCSQKLNSLELRHCEQSPEQPAACRMIESYISASGRGCVSKAHIETFCGFVKANEPEDFSYGYINYKKDIARAQHRCLVLFFKHTSEKSIQWLDIQMCVEADQTGALASFSPAFRALVEAQDVEAFKKLPDLEQPQFKGLRAMWCLIEVIDHKDIVHERDDNFKTFLMPHRFQASVLKVLSFNEFDEKLKQVPPAIRAAFEAYPDEPGMTPGVKFTEVIKTIYNIALASQLAKAAIKDAQFKEQEVKDAQESGNNKEINEKYWRSKQDLADKLLKVLPEEELWLLKIKASESQLAKEMFQENLADAGGTSNEVLGCYVEPGKSSSSSSD